MPLDDIIESCSDNNTPPKFNIAPENDGWKITFLLGWLIVRGYVKLPGCTFFFLIGSLWGLKCEHWFLGGTGYQSWTHVPIAISAIALE